MITKETSYEKIEVFPDGSIRVSEMTTFTEDGVVIANIATRRKMIPPGEDVTKEIQDVKDIAATVHTQAKIDAYRQKHPEEGVTK